MRILWAKDRVATPWKNGGGTTSEVIVFPDRAGFDDFGWRVSIARVDSSGPFSVFAGIDRHLAMLKGRVVLKISGRAPVEISPETQPVSFPGDAPTEADVVDGPATDLNVMTRRGAFRATMIRRKLEGRIAFTHTTLAFPLTRTTVNEFALDKEDAIFADASDVATVAPATEFYWIEITAA